MNNILNKYILKFKNPKALIILGISGIVLIYFSTLFGGSDNQYEGNTTSTNISVEEYREQLEEELCDIVKKITGGGKVSAVITLESGIKYTYADIKEEATANKKESENESNETELKEGYITVKAADGGEKALIITENMPEIRGVAIVCEGGDNEIINEKIKNAVTAAFNITSKRVYVCGGNW